MKPIQSLKMTLILALLTALSANAWDAVRLIPSGYSDTYYKNNTPRAITMMGYFPEGKAVFFVLETSNPNEHHRVVFRDPDNTLIARYVSHFTAAYTSGKKLRYCYNPGVIAEGPGNWNGYATVYNYSVVATDPKFQYVFE